MIKGDDRRVVKVRRVAVGAETGDRKGTIDSPFIAAVAIVTAQDEGRFLMGIAGDGSD